MLILMVYTAAAFMTWLAGGQINSYNRGRRIKNYFATRGLKNILICNDTITMNFWTENIDKAKYGQFEIVNTKGLPVAQKSMWEFAVKKAGVMKYPCMLTLENNELRGKFFRQTC
jgi:hypothetical protein